MPADALQKQDGAQAPELDDGAPTAEELDFVAREKQRLKGLYSPTPESNPYVDDAPGQRDNAGNTDDNTMDIAAEIRRAARTLSDNELRKLLRAVAAEVEARENKGRAAAEPRRAGMPEPASPPPVTAEQLFGNVPLTFQVKAHQKYEFSRELLDNHDAFKKAEKIANARSYRVHQKGETLPSEEDKHGLLAAAFVSQFRRRHGLTKPRSRQRNRVSHP